MLLACRLFEIFVRKHVTLKYGHNFTLKIGYSSFSDFCGPEKFIYKLIRTKFGHMIGHPLSCVQIWFEPDGDVC